MLMSARLRTKGNEHNALCRMGQCEYNWRDRNFMQLRRHTDSNIRKLKNPFRCLPVLHCFSIDHFCTSYCIANRAEIQNVYASDYFYISVQSKPFVSYTLLLMCSCSIISILSAEQSHKIIRNSMSLYNTYTILVNHLDRL